ncbi:hypothetical protein [Arcticibacter eurypsychrophilus]|uniref:hypothetical protein n=1 Tax=Arcticibacter eurypsychrophilus TaxID=1434752 RepID=UPI00147D386E|nr:hypothetical protein [Arcticibacter eurypsychrophilus]
MSTLTTAPARSSGGSLTRMLSFEVSSTPASHILCRKATSSVGTQGIAGLK